MGRGGESVLLNPANLWASSASDAYVDFALLNLNYKVTTPEPGIKPGQITIPVLPLPSVGGNYKFGHLAIGSMLLPTGIGSTTKVEDFPVELDGKYQVVSVAASQKGYKAGLGLAYKIGSKLSLGVSAIYDTSETTSTINLTENDAIVTKTNAKFIRPVIGLRYVWSGVGTFALSYQAKKEIPYTISIVAFGAEPQYLERRNYRPTVYGLGLQTRRFGAMRFYGQYSYEVWVPATLFAQPPNNALASESQVEFLNTHNYVLGGRYRLASKNTLGFSYGAYSKNKGPGLLSEKREILMGGRGAQDFEALDRTHLTASYEIPGKKTDWVTYASFIRGSALNPEGESPNAGYYELRILMLGIGSVFR